MPTPSDTPLQDLYPAQFAHCYGCGRLNAHGHHVQTFWREGEGVASFAPLPQHIALPGFVYGGLLASIIDCHAIATAAAATMTRDGLVPGRDATPRFVTGSLHVDYLRPTPLGPTLELRASASEVHPRKAWVDIVIRAGGEECVRGRVLAVRMPESMERAS